MSLSHPDMPYSAYRPLRIRLTQFFDSRPPVRIIPTAETILPRIRENSAEIPQDLLFLPDRETAQKDPAMYCLINSIYRIMLSHNVSAQAATTIAMRSACDNADESLEKLETLINRIRQAEVTNSVIETTSFLAGNYMEN